MTQKNALHERAATLYNLRRYVEAEQAFREILVSQPEDAWAHAFLARAIGNQQKKERWEEALREAQAAIHADPNYAEGYCSLAIVKFYRAPGEAEQALNDAIRLDPETPRFYALLGQLHLFTDQPAKALDAALAGRLVDPQDTGCANIHAVALMRLGRGKDARRVITEALRGNPEDAQAHAARGWSLLADGQNELARAAAWAVLIFYIPILFALGLGMARPVFNLLLRFDKYARLSLSREQIIQSNWVIASLTAGLLGLIATIISGSAAFGGMVLLGVLFGCLPFLGTADPRVRKDEMRPY